MNWTKLNNLLIIGLGVCGALVAWANPVAAIIMWAYPAGTAIDNAVRDLKASRDA